RRGAGAGDLLHGNGVGERVEAGAAVLGREDHPEEVELPHLLDVLPRELGGFVELGRARRDLAVRELAEGAPQERLLFGQLVKVDFSCGGHNRHVAPRGAGPTGITVTSSMMRSASVAARTWSTVTSGACSLSRRPWGVTSITARSVMMRSTTFRPVRG